MASSDSVNSAAEWLVDGKARPSQNQSAVTSPVETVADEEAAGSAADVAPPDAEQWLANGSVAATDWPHSMPEQAEGDPAKEAELAAKVKELQTELHSQAKESRAERNLALKEREKELTERFEAREAALEKRIERLESQVSKARKPTSDSSSKGRAKRAGAASTTPKPSPKTPTKKPTARRDGRTSKANGALDLNEATFEQLRELGLSITLSARVIAYRDVRGGYDSLEELDELPGLSKETRDRLKGQLAVRS